MADHRDRERVAASLLDSWPWQLGGCLIGGYAVAAYGRPRYSRDLDFVAPSATARSIGDWITGLGFSTRPPRTRAGQLTFADAQTFEKGDVSVDLMIGRVRDRGTQVSIPEDVISKDSRRTRLELISGSTEGEVTVCRPEAIWALKLVAARDQDLSDLFAISEEPVVLREVWSILERFQTPKLISNLQQIPNRLESKKIFLDALSARSMPTEGKLEAGRRWHRFVSRFEPLRAREAFPFRLE